MVAGEFVPVRVGRGAGARGVCTLTQKTGKTKSIGDHTDSTIVFYVKFCV